MRVGVDLLIMEFVLWLARARVGDASVRACARACVRSNRVTLGLRYLFISHA